MPRAKLQYTVTFLCFQLNLLSLRAVTPGPIVVYCFSKRTGRGAGAERGGGIFPRIFREEERQINKI